MGEGSPAKLVRFAIGVRWAAVRVCQALRGARFERRPVKQRMVCVQPDFGEGHGAI
jgi:hypothetical protein